VKNRYLLIGDPYWGVESGTPGLFADLLLCKNPTLPLDFLIDSSSRNTLDRLFQTCPREIIGRKAGTTILCAGWTELQGPDTVESVIERFDRLVQEIQHNSQTQLWIMTLPENSMADSNLLQRKLKRFNDFIRTDIIKMQLKILDFDAMVQDYQHLQKARQDMMRSLFTETGELNGLGQMLLALSLAQAMQPPVLNSAQAE